VAEVYSLWMLSHITSPELFIIYFQVKIIDFTY